MPYKIKMIIGYLRTDGLLSYKPTHRLTYKDKIIEFYTSDLLGTIKEKNSRPWSNVLKINLLVIFWFLVQGAARGAEVRGRRVIILIEDVSAVCEGVIRVVLGGGLSFWGAGEAISVETSADWVWQMSHPRKPTPPGRGCPEKGCFSSPVQLFEQIGIRLTS